VARRIIRTALALLTTAVAACGGSPSGPGPVTPAAPQIACGAAIAVDSITTISQPVNYAAPTVTGGAAPVAVACAPASGSVFELGTTTVTCNASDAQARQASCSFTVTLSHRELAVTKFLAFGDSMTEGENGRPLSSIDSFIDTPNAYPTILQQYFNERIPGQQITVANAGRGGENASDPDANERLKKEIAKNQPQVLLLLEGINDLNGGTGPNTVVNALRDHIRTARDRGVQYVLVSTILPTAIDVCLDRNQVNPPCRAKTTPAGQPAQVNQAIRSMVASSGAFLVDPYDEFVANRATYIDIDGLHLRPAGNRALATAFWNRIIEVIPSRQLFGS
jgi:lysophospholipase L1-like esterase